MPILENLNQKKLYNPEIFAREYKREIFGWEYNEPEISAREYKREIFVWEYNEPEIVAREYNSEISVREYKREISVRPYDPNHDVSEVMKISHDVWELNRPNHFNASEHKQDLLNSLKKILSSYNQNTAFKPLIWNNQKEKDQSQEGELEVRFNEIIVKSGDSTSENVNIIGESSNSTEAVGKVESDSDSIN